MFKKNEPNQRSTTNINNATKPVDPGFGRKADAHNAKTNIASNGAHPAQSSKPKHQGPRAVIGASVVIKGEIQGDEDVSIYGSVNGSIKLNNNNLLIGESGKIDANVEVRSVDIDGKFKGEIKATERITVRKSGNVNGNIDAPRVMLEDGCRFEGQITMANKP